MSKTTRSGFSTNAASTAAPPSPTCPTTSNCVCNRVEAFVQHAFVIVGKQNARATPCPTPRPFSWSYLNTIEFQNVSNPATVKYYNLKNGVSRPLFPISPAVVYAVLLSGPVGSCEKRRMPKPALRFPENRRGTVTIDSSQDAPFSS